MSVSDVVWWSVREEEPAAEGRKEEGDKGLRGDVEKIRDPPSSEIIWESAPPLYLYQPETGGIYFSLNLNRT